MPSWEGAIHWLCIVHLNFHSAAWMKWWNLGNLAHPWCKNLSKWWMAWSKGTTKRSLIPNPSTEICPEYHSIGCMQISAMVTKWLFWLVLFSSHSLLEIKCKGHKVSPKLILLKEAKSFTPTLIFRKKQCNC